MNFKLKIIKIVKIKSIPVKKIICVSTVIIFQLFPGINQEVPGNQKQTQQKSAMITKNGLLRPNRNSSLITSSKSKSKPTKIESIEPDIDFTNIPTIQGTYKAEKVNATTSSNKTNPTREETAKVQSDTRNNTKLSSLPIQEQSTKKSIIVKNSTETSQTVTQTVTNKMNEKLNYTVHDESFSNVHSQSSKKFVTSTVSSTIKTKDDQDVFKDFRNPDFETSPWKPIIPGYINTELKLLPDNVEKTNYKKTETNYKVNYTNTNVGDVVSDTSMKMTPQYSIGEIPEIPTKPSEPLGILNSYADVPGMSTFDIRDTDFPRDRIVPQEMVNFRVNGKFKNKIPGLLEDGQIFTESSPIEMDDKRPDIEVSGQLPSETYDIKLRTSSKPFGFSSSQPFEFSSTKPHPSTNENETGWRVAGSSITDTRYEESIRQDDGVKDDSIKANKKKMDQGTAKDKESSDNLLLSVISSTQKWPAQLDYEESTTKVSGVGVAEPVPDADVELEPRNRYSEVQATDKQQNNNALKDRKVDKDGQQPIYTSYKTPDLNGAGIRPSLIESSGTLKPFRHTIPVDKITSVVDYGKTDEEGSFRQEINTVTDSIINQGERFTEASQLNSTSKGSDEEAIKIVPENLKEIIELETLKKTSNDSETISTKSSRIEEHGGTRVPIELNTESIIDDEKFLKLSTTEIYSEMIHPLYNNVDKLVVRNEGNKERLTSNISRNSTFIEIDTLKHTPGEDEEDGSSKDKSSTKNEGSLNGTVNRPYVETRKKIYNDTLKAYVVENLVTLAPAKSNTGIGRPVRPRPKIDRVTSSDDSQLLDRLFRVPGRDRNTTKRNSSNGRDTIPFQSNNEGRNKEHPKIEQIVEVVTSISTKVSSNFKGNPIVLKFVVTNSTSLPVIRSESHGEQVSSSQISVPEQLFSALENGKEENRSFGDFRVSNKTPSLTSDRKISTNEENRSLLERLKQFAEIGAENEPVKGKDNSKSHSSVEQGGGDHRPLPDFEKLKHIADIATGNETLMNSSAGFTMTRDGVEILTKILNKMEDRTDKMISSTEENLEAGKNFILRF